jgi:hypothetical protein
MLLPDIADDAYFASCDGLARHVLFDDFVKDA